MTDVVDDQDGIRTQASDSKDGQIAASSSPLLSRAAIGLFGLSFFERTASFTFKFLIILVFTDRMGLPDDYAALVFGATVTAQSLFYSISGLISDRLLGVRHTLALGLLLVVPAYLALSIAVDYRGTTIDGSFLNTILFCTIAILVSSVVLVRLAGFNLIKSTLPEGDVRSEKLYVLYYWVESIGALIASFCAGTFVQKFGWTPIFGTLTAGMVACTLLVYFNRNQLTFRSSPETQQKKPFFACAVIGLLMVSAFTMLSIPALAGLANATVAIGIVIFIYKNLHEFQSAKHKEFLLSFSLVTIACLLFAALQDQQWSSLVLFASRVVDRNAFGIALHPSHFQSIIPIILVSLGPIVATLLSKKEFTTPGTRLSALLRKLSVAFTLLVISFVALFISTYLPGAEERIHWSWLVMALVIAGPAELFIYPVAFNTITANAPKKLASTMSGIHFTCYAGAGFLGGALASLAGGVPTEQGLEAVVLNYREFFGLVASIGGVLVLICVGASLWFSGRKSLNEPMTN